MRCKLHTSRFIFLPLLFALFFFSSCSKPRTKPLKVFSGEIFGTTYRILIADKNLPQQANIALVLHNEIKSELATIDKIFSSWNKDSVLSMVNKAPINRWINIPKDLSYLIEISQRINKTTSGYFDIALGNAIDRWGFGKDRISKINNSKIKNGMRFLQSQPKNLRIKKLAGITLNLSAIAKGYAVDVISKVLVKRGYLNHLVEIGGEIQARGVKYNKKWSVAIERPNVLAPQLVIKIKDKAMATSGDYRNFVLQGDKKMPHILNPDTGNPIDNQLTSVSILHNNAMTADAFATALMAMGFKIATKFAEDNSIAAYFIARKNDTFVVSKSTEWKSVVLK